MVERHSNPSIPFVQMASLLTQLHDVERTLLEVVDEVDRIAKQTDDPDVRELAKAIRRLVLSIHGAISISETLHLLSPPRRMKWWESWWRWLKG